MANIFAKQTDVELEEDGPGQQVGADHYNFETSKPAQIVTSTPKTNNTKRKSLLGSIATPAPTAKKVKVAEPNSDVEPAAKKQVKKEKKEKDPSAPKRATGAFAFYMSVHKVPLKLAAERWKKLSDEDKAPYVKLAEEDKLRAKEERTKYNDDVKHGLVEVKPKPKSATRRPSASASALSVASDFDVSQLDAIQAQIAALNANLESIKPTISLIPNMAMALTQLTAMLLNNQDD